MVPEAKLQNKTFWTGLASDLKNYLVSNQKIEIFRNPDLKLYSRVGESETEFTKRCEHAADDVIIYTDGSEELFDLENDPNEFTNLAVLPENKDLVSEMRLKMLDMKIRTEDPLPRNIFPTAGDITPLSSTGRKPLIKPE